MKSSYFSTIHSLDKHDHDLTILKFLEALIVLNLFSHDSTSLGCSGIVNIVAAKLTITKMEKNNCAILPQTKNVFLIFTNNNNKDTGKTTDTTNFLLGPILTKSRFFLFLTDSSFVSWLQLSSHQNSGLAVIPSLLINVIFNLRKNS